MRHVARRVGRPVGGSGSDAGGRARRLPGCRRQAGRRATGHTHPVRWRCRPGRHAPRTAPSTTPAGGRVGLRSAPHVPRVAPRSAGSGTSTGSRTLAPHRRRGRIRVEVQRALTAPPVLKAIGAPTGTTITVSPSLAEIDRGFHEIRPTSSRSSGAPAQRPDRARSDHGSHRSPEPSRAEPRCALPSRTRWRAVGQARPSRNAGSSCSLARERGIFDSVVAMRAP